MLSINKLNFCQFSMKEKLQSRITETDNTIQAMKIEMNNTKSACQKEVEHKNQLIKENQEKVHHVYNCANGSNLYIILG